MGINDAKNLKAVIDNSLKFGISSELLSSNEDYQKWIEENSELFE